MYSYAISLLDKKPDYIILHIGTNYAPYKSGSDILNVILDLKNFIKEKYPDCMKITLFTPTIRNDNENPKNKIKLFKQKHSETFKLRRFTSEENRFYDSC